MNYIDHGIKCIREQLFQQTILLEDLLTIVKDEKKKSRLLEANDKLHALCKELKIAEEPTPCNHKWKALGGPGYDLGFMCTKCKELKK